MPIPNRSRSPVERRVPESPDGMPIRVRWSRGRARIAYAAAARSRRSYEPSGTLTRASATLIQAILNQRLATSDPLASPLATAEGTQDDQKLDLTPLLSGKILEIPPEASEAFQHDFLLGMWRAYDRVALGVQNGCAARFPQIHCQPDTCLA
eukprot:GABV01008721.1.p2 GENE.GABV01008721.1~~GABV01008721.1.p2  ORF type:complete len:152 (+),score=48.66 GABV01008721.1:470-925(+)